MTLGQVVASQNSLSKKRSLYREGIKDLPHSAPTVEKDGPQGASESSGPVFCIPGAGYHAQKPEIKRGISPMSNN